MDLTHGILMFFIGCSITLIGFFIAFLVIRYNISKEYKRELTEAEKSIKELHGQDCQWN